MLLLGTEARSDGVCLCYRADISMLYPENHNFHIIPVDLATRDETAHLGNSLASEVGVGTETSRTVFGVNSG